MCSRATFSSRDFGSTYTPRGYCSVLVNNSICASTWLVKLIDMTKLGWPVALPRFRSRPSERAMIEWPSGNTNSWTCGLTSILRTSLSLARPAMSISLSKWPMLPTMALCFIRPMGSALMMSLLPVTVGQDARPASDAALPLGVVGGGGLAPRAHPLVLDPGGQEDGGGAADDEDEVGAGAGGPAGGVVGAPLFLQMREAPDEAQLLV